MEGVAQLEKVTKPKFHENHGKGMYTKCDSGVKEVNNKET